MSDGNRIFEFYGFHIRVRRTPTGVTVEVAQDAHFDAVDTTRYDSRSRDPLSVATLLATDLDMHWPDELEALADCIAADME